MEITKYLCEFFFTDFWHWLGLVVALYTVGFHTVIIKKDNQITSKENAKEK